MPGAKEDKAATVERLRGFAQSRLERVGKTHDLRQVAFVIGKNENENTVVYKGNFKGPALSNPCLQVFWIKYKIDAAGGHEQDLKWIEKTSAYGIDAKPLADGRHQVALVSLPKNPIVVGLEEIEGQQQVVARCDIDGVAGARLLCVYVTCKDGWLPGVKYVDVVGHHPETGETLVQRVSG
eukprot:TRINITY_DN6548_c0_g1_i1.p1 TRINITY_DN6548_c0_g1~~TRINITY_DN6548_c0_g1_i1.p1  ORF type:complete len:181 (+),score=45.87 TRINITY_DN6548_c0_g1_i1:80-622(+)